jgi:TonB family protein
LLILLIIFQPKLFPYRPPTQESVDLGKDLGFIYEPPDIPGARAPTPSPAIRVNPGELRRVAPSLAAPMPAPIPKQPDQPAARQTPVEPPPDLAPVVRPQPESDKPPDFLRGPTAQTPAATITPQNLQPKPNGLILPKSSSPGRALQDSESQALRGNELPQLYGGGQLPGSGGGGGGHSGAEGGLGLQMLTPTDGVDFNSYLARVVASVKRNWFSIMPESALLGDRGRVVLQFRIMKNGDVPSSEPQLMDSSNKEPLDRAAIGAIRASSPFEPLPTAFSGPYIELRFIFLYNLPLNN